jgi:hypothetical protein
MKKLRRQDGSVVCQSAAAFLREMWRALGRPPGSGCFRIQIPMPEHGITMVNCFRLGVEAATR